VDQRTQNTGHQKCYWNVERRKSLCLSIEVGACEHRKLAGSRQVGLRCFCDVAIISFRVLLSCTQWRHRSAGGPLTDLGQGAPPLDPNQLKCENSNTNRPYFHFHSTVCECDVIGPILWGHSGPLCHALSCCLCRCGHRFYIAIHQVSLLSHAACAIAIAGFGSSW